MCEGRRVLHVITRFILGGAQLVCLEAVSELRRRGWDARIAAGPAVGSEGELFGEARRRGIPVVKIPDMRREILPARDLRAWLHLRETIRGFRPHVVHTHSSKAGVLGRFAASAEGTPLVVHTCHGLPFGYGRSPAERLYAAAELRAAARCDFVLCIAGNLAERLAALGVPRSKLMRVPWGMDFSAFEKADRAFGRALLGLPPEPSVLVTPARLAPDKGHEDALWALAELRREGRRAVLVLIGDGPLKGELKAAAERMGLADAVRFAGRVPRSDMPHYLAAGDVLLLPSVREGVPIVIVEGYAAGLPAAAYDTDGVGEVLRDGETGFSAPPGDRRALLDAVRRLLDEPHLRARFAAAGKELAAEYGAEAMGERLDRLYREKLKEKETTAAA